MFQHICNFIHKENVSLTIIMQIIHLFVIYFDYAYLIRLCDVNKPTIWPLPLVYLQIFKHPQLPHFSTDLDKTGIKSDGLLQSFI